MSQEAQVVKKRGRPKKAAVENESIVVIDTSAKANTEARTTKTKASSVKKTRPQSISTASTVERRTVKKVVVDDNRQDEASMVKLKATRRSAKSQRDATGELQRPASNILNQATAFKTLSEEKEGLTVPATSQAILPEADAVSERLDYRFIQQQTDLIQSTEFETVRTNLTSLTSGIRELSIDRANVSLDRLSNNIKQSSDAAVSLTTKLRQQQINIDLRIADINQRLHSLTKTTQESTSDLASFLQTRRSSRIQQIETDLHGLIESIEQSQTTIEHLKSALPFSARLVDPFIEQVESQLDSLTHEIRQSIETLQQSKLTPQSPAPSTPTPSSPAPAIPPTMPSHSARSPMAASTTTTTIPPPPNPSKLQPRIRPSRPIPTPPPSNPMPNANSNSSPSRPRFTDQSYESLQRNPAFRRKSREWTGLMVGIPVVIVSSIVLVKRYQETAERNRLEKTVERVRGEVPSDVEEAVRLRTQKQDG